MSWEKGMLDNAAGRTCKDARPTAVLPTKQPALTPQQSSTRNATTTPAISHPSPMAKKQLKSGSRPMTIEESYDEVEKMLEEHMRQRREPRPRRIEAFDSVSEQAPLQRHTFVCAGGRGRPGRGFQSGIRHGKRPGRRRHQCQAQVLWSRGSGFVLPSVSRTAQQASPFRPSRRPRSPSRLPARQFERHLSSTLHRFEAISSELGAGADSSGRWRYELAALSTHALPGRVPSRRAARPDVATA
jgi:hypothetical protein